MTNLESMVIYRIARYRSEYAIRQGHYPRVVKLGIFEHSALVKELSSVIGGVEEKVGKHVDILNVMGMELQIDPHLVGIRVE